LDTNDSHPQVKLIAANPRSYAYIDDRRLFPADIQEKVDTIFLTGQDFTELEFRELTSQEMQDCPEYNRYEWGLQENDELPTPYVMSNLEPFQQANDQEAFCRYASRNVVYLSGERDMENVGNQICNEDGYQGPTRRERSERFYASLQVMGEEAGYCGMEEESVHERVVVKNVGHDHGLIYIMEEGQRVLFE
jgi:hypothetical protein